MRVVLVDDAVSFGGAQIAAVNMAMLLRETFGHDIIFWCSEQNVRLVRALRQADGITVRTDGYAARPLFIVSHLLYLWRLPKLVSQLRGMQAGLVIVNMAGLEFGWLYSYAARLALVRRICWLHNPFRYSDLLVSKGWRGQLNRARDWLAAKFANIIWSDLHIVSGSSRAYLLERLGRSSGVKVFGNVVQAPAEDAVPFDYGPLVLPHFDAKIIAVVPGRIDFGPKAQDQVCAALAELRSRGVAVVFVGDGADLPALRQGCLPFENAFFVGWQECIVPYLKGADVILLPSRLESQPLILFEVMFLQVPVLISGIPAFMEMLDHRFSVDFSDPPALAAAVNRIVAMDPAVLAAAYEEGRSRVSGSKYLANVDAILKGVSA